MSEIAAENKGSNFIRNIVAQDKESNKHQGRVATRFPPEPNGYLHIGHAKSICLNFGLARDFGGTCNLRFDDTNPAVEEVEYIESIQRDVQWLGFKWNNLFYASDYFGKLYGFAVELIKSGKAYVCSLSPEDTRKYRGSLTEAGKHSPDRNRSVEENLDLFERMKKGEFEEGKYTLRAKIDMASPNINLRDPALYRIRKVHHHRTGDEWCIYPMYDYAHCVSDALENITHSVCTLEFEDHRPLYDWCLDNITIDSHPQQIEFARLNLSYTIMSKRKLLELVNGKHVGGWDDPRIPTISGMRRRGYTPAAIRNFCEQIGVTKKESCIDVMLLENCVRDDLNQNAKRAMGVLNPIKVVLTNYPEGQSETLEAPWHPNKEDWGKRQIPFGREIYIDADDFMENPPKGFFRLVPGGEVRLRYAYIIKCEKVIKDASGKVTELHCTYDVDTKSGAEKVQKKVKGVIHWVPVQGSLTAEVRVYDRLFGVEDPDDVPEGKSFLDHINSHSLDVISKAHVEPAVKGAKAEEAFQFERLGYFCVDKDSKENALVFNRTVTLRDTWAKAK